MTPPQRLFGRCSERVLFKKRTVEVWRTTIENRTKKEQENLDNDTSEAPEVVRGPLVMQWDLGTPGPIPVVVVDRNSGSAPVNLFTLPTAKFTNEKRKRDKEKH